MSIDKLISELDREPRDLVAIKTRADQGVHDYIVVSEAYVSLLGTVLDKDAQVDLLCNILSEIIENIRGLNKLKSYLNQADPNLSELDIYTGQVLRGEQSIDMLIAQFEALDN